VAVKNDGTVWAWGNNFWGQLGTGTSGYEGTSAQYITTPVQVPGGTSGTTYLTGAIAVSAGFDHTLVLKGDGTVWAWGGSQSGQLGNGTQGINHGQSNYYLSAPVQVSGLTNIKSISAANYFSIALTTGGNVWTWGDNTWSNLGINKTWSDQNVSLVPVEVKGPSGTGALSNIDLVSARGVHCLAYQSTSGNIYGWGSDV
jgi:alpha-tubulin suppressor-like RCC1 family protein